VVDYIYLGLYGGFRWLLHLLPIGAIVALIRGLSSFAYRVGSRHRHIINSNLNLAFANSITKEEIDTIGRASYANLLDTIFGIMRRDGIDRDEVIESITFEGEEILQRAIESNQKIIFVTGHYGNWELLSQALAIRFDLELVGVGRKLDSEPMDRLLKENREKFNVEMVYKRGAMKGCIKALNSDKAVGILIDQSLPLAQGVEVEFFGHRATHTSLASILARRYESDLIPVFIHTNDYIHYHTTIYPPLAYQKSDNLEADILAMTQAQADMMESIIKEDPKQWFWQHKRWKVFYKEMYQR
jgi:KDO2-lipid IV(A) lauroyltransferase